MFGETNSESPRMPSPWEAIATPTAPSPAPPASPLSVSNGVVSDRAPNFNADRKGMEAGMPLLDAELEKLSNEFEDGEVPVLKLAPEVEEGNVEYKLKLINPTHERFTKLVTQLKYRLLEGGGQALYEIGVSDSGQLVGLSRSDLDESLDTLERMAGELGATVVVLKEIELPPYSVAGETALNLSSVAGGVMKKVKGKGKGLGVRGGGGQRSGGLRTTVAKRTGGAPEIGTCSESYPETESGSSFVDSGVDLSANMSTLPADQLSPPNISAPSTPTSSSLPIIKSYPYGHQPFALSKRTRNKTTVPVTHQTDIEDYTYSASDKVTTTTEDEKDAFPFDLEIASLTNTLVGLAPSPHVKPSHAKKPLHYSSFSHHHHSHHSHLATGPGHNALQTGRPKMQHNVQHKPLFNKVANGGKKPIIPRPPALTPSEKLSERRAKRDAKREERRGIVNHHQLVEARDDDAIVTMTAELTVAEPSKDGHVKSAEHNGTTPLVEDAVGQIRVIAEALVVRKIALDEAFLDFGGFGRASDAAGQTVGVKVKYQIEEDEDEDGLFPSSVNVDGFFP